MKQLPESHLSKSRESIGMTVFRRARDALKSRILSRRNLVSRHPSVSVIIPFFNVEQYLHECVTSILTQTLQDIEIILVDDGSSDASTEIAGRFVDADSRVTLLTQPNSGPGAARNNALEHAIGRYLAFVDSDDRLPPTALSKLVESAQKNDADIAAGAIRRFNSTRSWVPLWVKDVHSFPRDGIILEDIPELLRNNYPVGKVFLRKFWIAQGLGFREGVIYEDQPLIAQVFSRAARLNVLTDLVYDYREREDYSSVSQRPGEIKDLRDRVAAWQLSLSALRAETSGRIVAAWYQTLYNTHLHWYLNNDSIRDPRYWQILHESFISLQPHEPADAFEQVSPEKRVALQLLRADRQDALVEFRAAGGYELGHFAAVISGSGLNHALPLSAELLAEMPRGTLISRPPGFDLRQEVVRGTWVEQNSTHLLRLEGFAYIRFLDLAELDAKVEVFAQSPDGEMIWASVVRSTDTALHPRSDDFADYRRSTFSAELDVGKIGLSPHGVGRWSLFVRVTAGELVLTEPLRNLSARSGIVDVTAQGLGHGLRARIVSNPNRHVPLSLVFEKPKVWVTSIRLNGRDLEMSFRSVMGEPITSVTVTVEGSRDSIVAAVRETGVGVWETSITIPPLVSNQHSAVESRVSWTVRANDRSGKNFALSWQGGVADEETTGNGLLRATTSAVGNLKLEEYPRGYVFVHSATSIHDGALTLVGKAANAHAGLDTELSFLDSDGDVAAQATIPEGNFESLIAFDSLTRRSGGERVVRVVAATGDTSRIPLALPLILAQTALLSLPFCISGTDIVVERAKGKSLSLRVYSNLGEDL